MFENPFRFGSPVAGDYYLERPPLRDSCLSLLANGMPILLMGTRRLGKTSFATNFCHHWQQEGYGETLLLDAYNVSSHQDFIIQLINALQQKQSLTERLKSWLTQVPERLWPSSVSLERQTIGKLTLSWLSEKTDAEKKLCILEILQSLERTEGKLCVVIDECQQLSKESLGDSGWLEATLRQMLQAQAGKVAYLLTGSRRDLIHAMVNDSKRPLYRSLQLIDFPRFDNRFSEWILQRFTSVGVRSHLSVIDYLRQQVQDSTNYIQMLCFHLVAHGVQHVDRPEVDRMLTTLVQQNAYSYETLLYNLSPVQQRVVRMLALEQESYFGDTLLKHYEISSGSHVTAAINALKKKNILDQDAPGRGRVTFDDPLFKLWIRHKWNGDVSASHGQQPLL